ncbi:hypothetical protein D3C72_1089330 [compost metagenome]
MLYISIDEDKYDQQWKEMIKYYELSGTHIRVNEHLRKELSKTIWGGDGEGFSIPTYIIIDKDGNIVEKNALRPSDKEKLYEQIENFF